MVGGTGIRGTAGWLEGLGFVPSHRNAMLAGLADGGGGLLRALGLLTPGPQRLPSR